MRIRTFVSVTCLAACAGTAAPSSSSHDALVGGTVETGYPAVGHVVVQLSGSALFLDDGTIAGTVISSTNDIDEQDHSDFLGCDERNAGIFTNVLFPSNVAFLAQRLAAIR